MLLKFLGLIAVVSVAMCLVPAGVHFFELANKMSMSSPEYRAEDLCGVVLFWHRGYRRASNHLDTHFHGTQRSYGLFSLACCVPLPSRHLGDLLDVHIPNERSEQQLDGHTGRLRGGAAAVGVCVRGDHPFCASHQSRSAVMQATWTQWPLEEDHALALGRLKTALCQRVKLESSGAIFMSAKRPPMSIATSAVMSAIVKRSPATNWCPLSSRSIRSSR